MSRVWKQMLDLIYPPRCSGCGQDGTEWCAECAQKVVRLSEPQTLCLTQYESPQTGMQPQDCPAEIQVYSYTRYAGPVIQAILALKYLPNMRLARVMADWLHGLLPHKCMHLDLLIAVPLSSKRRHKRGFNQVELITKQLAKMLQIPMARDAIRRTRDTGSQVGLHYKDRIANVDDAFVANRKLVQDKNILLVDDVTTTGATLIACSRAVFSSGAQNVVGITVARA